MDVTNKPKILRRYKVQKGTNEPVDKKRLRNVISVVLINQLFIGVPFLWLSFDCMIWRGFKPVRELPTFHYIIFELICCVIIEEICFYYSHR